MNETTVVRVRVEEVTFPTWLPAAPDKNPMFLEKRVYQGSSGRVYPLPFTDRIAEHPVGRNWKAVWIENQFLRVLVLPEIGGRIHAIQDKTNGYDLIYNQPVIKPALVGLAGPWISGGIEFNWPQHHRPATFLPVDFEVENHPDGAATVWCGDHDPMCRMKGMHGICLHPDRACVELKVRVYNRTEFVQTFLWWANAATRVHEGYQSFFPQDAHYVADHARRSMSEYPLAKEFYYGVNYGERGRKGIPANEIPDQFVPPHCRDSRFTFHVSRNGSSLDYAPNDLSFYANIPTPCSYMCTGSKEDFFGGYDHKAQAGIVHVANHHIAPGKKQWTWGNHEFGYAWDRNLTEPTSDGEFPPYIELMAGVYTDNQPDFSFLQPGETKSWSQYWYPIQRIGPPVAANLHTAVSLRTPGHSQDGRRLVELGVAVTSRVPESFTKVSARSKEIASFKSCLSPAEPLLKKFTLPPGVDEKDLSVIVTDGSGNELITYRATQRAHGKIPSPATEPPAPEEIATADELFITGLHLEQYHHATRCPTEYWREALRRDSGDIRCNTALGTWHLRRGEFGPAETHLRRAIQRLTLRNENPADGSAHYHLGLCLRLQLDTTGNENARALFDEAYASYYKATWNEGWAAASYHALAELDCRKANWAVALEHLEKSLRLNADNTRARNLKALVLSRLAKGGNSELASQAANLLKETMALDPLNWWTHHIAGRTLTCDLQTQLDVAHDYARAGFYLEAIDLLKSSKKSRLSQVSDLSPKRNPLPDQGWGAGPLVEYTLGWLYEKLHDPNDSAAHIVNGHRKSMDVALKHYRAAALHSPDYCFPARLEEIAILESAMRANRTDAKAAYYLGNLFYDRRRHEEAIRLWQRSAKLDPKFSIVWRNLGIAYFNIRKDASMARVAYDRAFRANPKDARLLFERDQLWKRIGVAPDKRLRELKKFPALVQARDDLSIELCALYNQTGRHAEARALIDSRNFQPWEGGEGAPLGQHVRSHLALGRQALATGNAAKAREHFETALTAPRNLGEAKHLLANQSDVHYWLGLALDELGEKMAARYHWLAAASFKGDFQEMSVRVFSEMTYYSALSWKQLGKAAKASKLLRSLLAYAKRLQKLPARIDYFATSLPTMLLFDDDLKFRQETSALFLQAQAHLGLANKKRAKALLKTVLKRDPNHSLAADLLADAA